MNINLMHTSLEPIMYGVALFLSFLSLAYKVKRNNYIGFAVELTVVSIILMVHGGSVTGGFAATIAGLLSGTAIPLLFPHNKKAPTAATHEVVTTAKVLITAEQVTQWMKASPANAGLAKHIFDNMPK